MAPWILCSYNIDYHFAEQRLAMHTQVMKEIIIVLIIVLLAFNMIDHAKLRQHLTLWYPAVCPIIMINDTVLI